MCRSCSRLRRLGVALVLPALLAAGAATAGAGEASVAAVAVAAATPDTLRLTLDEAVARARAGAPRLRQLRALAEAASGDARAARAGRLPTLDLRAGYSRWSDVPELILALPGAPPRTLFPNLPDNWTGRASLALPLWTGGRLAGAARAAARQEEAAARDTDSGEAALVLETVAAYWDLALARQRENVLGAAIAAYTAHADDTRNRLKFGMVASHELLAVEVERDRAELARLRATGDAETAAADLARLLDLPAGQPLAVADPLAAPPGGAEEALEPLVAGALAVRPERAALAARAAAAQALVGVARAGRLPQVALTAGYDYSNPNRRLTPPTDRFTDSWDVGVSLALNVFDGGRVAAAASAARARAAAAQAGLADRDRRIRLEVTARRLDLRTARAAAVVAARALASAAESRRVAADRYREGLIPSSELLDAETAQLRAGLEHAEALVSVRLAAAALARAAGRTGGW
ncbi:MAG: TolC family protein [Candidatus Krumholzibacteriia bacterium]